MIRTRRSFLSLITTTLVALPLCGVAHAQDTLAQRLQQALAVSELKHVNVGFLLLDQATGSTLFEQGADLRLTPASNNKLVTTAAALHLLGPDFRFSTSLYRTGSVDDEGVMRGNLVLQGTGDFTLDAASLTAFVASVKVAGIKRITGGIVIDDTAFDSKWLGDGWSWNYLDAGYAAPVGALTLNRSVIDLQFDPGMQAGDPVRVSAAPSARSYPISILAKTLGEGEKGSVTVARSLGAMGITLNGGLAKGQTSKASVSVIDPGQFAAVFLHDELRRSGIEISQAPAHGPLPAGAIRIGRHESEPLSRLISLVNKPSDNLGAECLLKAIDASGKPQGGGSWQGGIAKVQEWLKSIGVDTEGVTQKDGSGLSHQNMLTARAISQLLLAMSKHHHAKVFVDSLPIAGVDGTLASRMKGTGAAGNLRAKTGSLGHASSLSGYLTAKDGRKLIVAMMFNNFAGEVSVIRGIQDKIAAILAD